MVKKAVLLILLFIVIMSVPVGYLGYAFHKMKVITREFEAATSIARLSGKTEQQAIQLLGKPQSRSEPTKGEYFLYYKSREGEYASVHIHDGHVVGVSYYWQ